MDARPHRGQGVPVARAGLRGGHQAAARPRRREPLGRRQRPVVPRPGRRAEVRLPARHRQLLLHGRPDPGRQPAGPQGHKRSPLRPDVPCETQQAPDLRTIPRRRAERLPAASAPSADQLTKPLAGHRRVPADADQAAGPRPQGLRRPGQAPGARRSEARDPQAPARLRGDRRRCAAIATGVGGYVLSNQRLRFPCRGRAVPAQGRVLHRAGGHAGPGADRARVRRAHRRHREGRAEGRPRGRDDGARPASTRTSSTPTRPRCCARRPGLKDMFIELDPGTGRAPRRARGLDHPDREHAAGRQPRRGPVRRSTPTRATT